MHGIEQVRGGISDHSATARGFLQIQRGVAADFRR